VVVPIHRAEKIVAVFGVGNKEQEYNQGDIDILTSLGDMTWDIILRKGKEEALQQSEEQYRMQIELAMDGILLSSPEWIITGANRSLCQMLGMKEKDLIGRHIRDLPFTPESLQECPFRLDLLKQGEIVNSDRVLIRSDNTLVPVEMRTGRMPDGSYQSIFRDITERKAQEQQLAAALREKEVLLREVHHRVKNNLAAIISLMDMQRRNIEDARGQDVLTELSNRIRTMSLVHEKLYRADSLATIDFQDYTQALISHLRTTFGSPGIICRVDAPGITIPLDLASPCGLIVNELVTNALKYAFPEGKPCHGNTDCRILVRLHRDHDTFILAVADNGIGLPAGFDWTKTQTLGMILVRMLGQHQLRGQYVVDENKGTSFTLTFTNRKKGDPIHG
jgi:PAS domain S-box-containing protein